MTDHCLSSYRFSDRLFAPWPNAGSGARPGLRESDLIAPDSANSGRQEISRISGSDSTLAPAVSPPPSLPSGELQKEKRPQPPSFGPGPVSLAALDALLRWGLDQSLSDLILTAGQPPWLRRHGVFAAFGERALSPEETARLLIEMTSNEAAAAIVGAGRDLDFSYEIGRRGEKRRFRGNATAIARGRGAAISIALRAIPGQPPELGQLELEPGLLESLFPPDGLVLVTGVMGSGKSTLLAATLRRLAETGGRHIAAYEAPVEFDLAGLDNLQGPVEQTEIPTHLASFDLAPKNAARRAADVILVGETRDRDTLKSLIEAAGLGVTAYATAHTRGVAETPTHLINLFEPRERAAMATELLSTLRLIVQQRLYPRVGGGRIAVREFLTLTARDRRALQRLPLPELEGALSQMLEAQGQSLLTHAQELARLGRLAPEVALTLSQERGSR